MKIVIFRCLSSRENRGYPFNAHSSLPTIVTVYCLLVDLFIKIYSSQNSFTAVVENRLNTKSGIIIEKIVDRASYISYYYCPLSLSLSLAWPNKTLSTTRIAIIQMIAG